MAKFMNKTLLKIKALGNNLAKRGQGKNAAFWLAVLSLPLLGWNFLDSGASLVMAEGRTMDASPYLAASLIVNPIASADSDQTGESGLVLQNNLFLQADCLPGDAECYKKQSQAKINVKTAVSHVVVTAYSSTYDQTDDTPFITANGTYVYDGVVACNFLPFGTKIKLPEYSGDKIYTVQDRMAKRNSHKIDIWMGSRGSALDFGVKYLAIEVVD